MNHTFLVDKIKAYMFLLAAVFFMASFMIVIHTPPWLSFYNEWFVSISLFFLFLGVTLQSVKCTVGWPVWFLIVISFVPLLQFLFGIIYFFGHAFVVFLYIFGAAIAFFCGSNLSGNGYQKNATKLFSLMLVALGLLNIYFAWYQFFEYDYAGLLVVSGSGGRAYGNLLQPNNFSSILVLSVVAAWYLYEKNFLSKKIYMFAMFFLVSGVVLAQSRTGVLFGFCVFSLFLFYRNRIFFKVNIFDFLLIAVFYIFWLVFLDFFSESSLRALEYNDSNRMMIWLEMICSILDSPFFGYGWNQVSVAQTMLESPYDKSLPVNNSHNILLDLLIWNGPVLGALIILIFSYWVLKVLSSCRSIEVFISLSMCCMIGVHAMLELPLNYTYLLFPLFFLLGLIGLEPYGHNSGVIKRSYVVFVAVVFGIALLFIYKDYKVIEKEKFKQSVIALGFEREEMNFKNVHLLTHLPQVILFDAKSFGDTLSDKELLWAKRVSHAYVTNIRLRKYARAARINGKEAESERVLGVVDRLYVRRFSPN